LLLIPRLNRVLTSQRVAYNQTSGPDVEEPADPGPVTAVRWVAPSAMTDEEVLPSEVFVDFAGLANVNICGFADVAYAFRNPQVVVIGTNESIAGQTTGITLLSVCCGGVSSDRVELTVASARPLHLSIVTPLTEMQTMLLGAPTAP
jgi:hypothetical protein